MIVGNVHSLLACRSFTACRWTCIRWVDHAILLALPVARSAGPLLAASERELSRITAALVPAGESGEPALLNRLTQLEAEIENLQSETRYRFGAPDACHELMQRRID